MAGWHPAGYYFLSGKRYDAQIGLLVEGQFKELELVNTIHGQLMKLTMQR
jgi:hypothetical protein